MKILLAALLFATNLAAFAQIHTYVNVPVPGAGDLFLSENSAHTQYQNTTWAQIQAAIGGGSGILRLNGLGTNTLLYGTELQLSADFTARQLYDTTGVGSLDFQNRILLDSGALNSVQWNSRLLLDSGNKTSLDWQNRTANDNTAATVFTWSTAGLTLNKGSLNIATGPPLITFGPLWNITTNSGGFSFSNSVASGVTLQLTAGHQLLLDSVPVLTNLNSANPVFLSTLSVSNQNSTIGLGSTNYVEFRNTNSGAVPADFSVGTNGTIYFRGGSLTKGGAFTTTGGGFALFGGGLSANTLQSGGTIAFRGGQSYIDSRMDKTTVLLDSTLSAVSSLQWGVSNMTKVANYTLAELDVGTTVNNIGAGIPVTNTLIAAALRKQFGFYVGANSNLCVAAIPGTDVIYWNGWSGTNLVCGVSNSYAHMFSPGPGAWIVDSLSGPWKGLTNSAGVGMPSSAPAPTAISPFPGTTVNWTNTFGVPIQVYIDNTAITGTAIKKNGTQIFGGLSNDTVLTLYPSEYFSETYTVGTPTATWSPMQ
jgi:hypothetical protein